MSANELKKPDNAFVIAISGPACAGKTTLAKKLASVLDGFLIAESVREVLDALDTTMNSVTRDYSRNGFARFQREILNMLVENLTAVFKTAGEQPAASPDGKHYIILDRGPLDILMYSMIGLVKRGDVWPGHYLSHCLKQPYDDSPSPEVLVTRECLTLLNLIDLQLICDPVNWVSDGVRSMTGYGGQLFERVVLEGLVSLIDEETSDEFTMPIWERLRGGLLDRLCRALEMVLCLRSDMTVGFREAC